MIWYIHGANSSPTSFAWIKQQLPCHQFRDVTYSTDTPLRETIDRLAAEAQQTQHVNIVAHSMGGLIALGISAKTAVRRILTISTPFGGSRLASILRWYFPCQMLDDIATNSRVLTDLRTQPLMSPVRALVTTGGGTPLMREENDGVVTVASQMMLDGPDYVRMPHNHFEVLLTNDTVRHVEEFILR